VPVLDAALRASGWTALEAAGLLEADTRAARRWQLYGTIWGHCHYERYLTFVEDTFPELERAHPLHNVLLERLDGMSVTMRRTAERLLRLLCALAWIEPPEAWLGWLEALATAPIVDSRLEVRFSRGTRSATLRNYTDAPPGDHDGDLYWSVD
jgi:hypothetical protein